MQDTRIHQIRSLATEGLKLTDELRDENPDNLEFAEDLRDLRRYLNWVVSRTGSMLSRATCTALTMSGGRCEQPKGHDGPHVRVIAANNTPYVWTDESESELIDQWGAKQL